MYYILNFICIYSNNEKKKKLKQKTRKKNDFF